MAPRSTGGGGESSLGPGEYNAFAPGTFEHVRQDPAVGAPSDDDIKLSLLRRRRTETRTKLSELRHRFEDTGAGDKAGVTSVPTAMSTLQKELRRLDAQIEATETRIAEQRTQRETLTRGTSPAARAQQLRHDRARPRSGPFRFTEPRFFYPPKSSSPGPGAHDVHRMWDAPNLEAKAKSTAPGFTTSKRRALHTSQHSSFRSARMRADPLVSGPPICLTPSLPAVIPRETTELGPGQYFPPLYGPGPSVWLPPRRPHGSPTQSRPPGSRNSGSPRKPTTSSQRSPTPALSPIRGSVRPSPLPRFVEQPPLAPPPLMSPRG